MMWKIDSKKNAIDATVQLFEDNHVMIDLESREIFKAGVTQSALKCVTRYNHCRKRYKIINLNAICSKCLQCNKEKIW